MKHSIDWWAGAAGALLGAIIGGCIPLYWTRRQRRIERSGEVWAMLVEMLHGRRLMRTLLMDNIAAPLYRLPVETFERALPKLIGEEQLKPREVAVLIEYTMRIEEVNRGLDRARAAHLEQRLSPLHDEFERNKEKVTEILDVKQGHLGNKTIFDVALGALRRLDNKNIRRWWRPWSWSSTREE